MSLLVIRKAVHDGAVIHPLRTLLFRVFPRFPGATFIEILKIAGCQHRDSGKQQKVAYFFHVNPICARI